MNKYEAVVVFKPTVEEVARGQVLDRLKEAITEAGTVTNVDEWGMRKLAYEINYIKEGYYYIVNFEAEPTVVAEFERRARIADQIIRYMVIRLEDK